MTCHVPYQREADAMRQQYEADTNGESEDGAGPRQQRDYRLQEGQTLHIALPDKVRIGNMAAAASAPGAAQPCVYRATCMSPISNAGRMHPACGSSCICCQHRYYSDLALSIAGLSRAGHEEQQHQQDRRTGESCRRRGAAEDAGLWQRRPAAASAGAFVPDAIDPCRSRHGGLPI